MLCAVRTKVLCGGLSAGQYLRVKATLQYVTVRTAQLSSKANDCYRCLTDDDVVAAAAAAAADVADKPKNNRAMKTRAAAVAVALL